MSKFHIIQQHLKGLSTNNQKGSSFELICKWFLENDFYYQKEFKKVWLWKDWPDKWHAREKGADLIAQTYDGKYWAIQAKAYDENYYIRCKDIDRFLNESNREKISYRLLIATTDNIGPNAEETLEKENKENKPINRLLLHQLKKLELDWNLALKNKKSEKPVPLNPRSHQKQALEDIFKGFKTSSCGQVRMACGTGKSLLGFLVAQKLQPKYTLILVPSLSLVSQLYKTWSQNSASFDFKPIFVCSDKTVGKNKKKDESDMTVAEFGYRVTTKATEVIEILQNNIQPVVVFSTYQSSFVIKEVCDLKKDFIFDLVIADEAHRTAGKSTSEFAVITRENAIPSKRKLYMTATPRIYTENVKRITKEHDIEIASMDNQKIYGPVFHTLLFSDAIKQNLLTDYQVVISILNHDTYRQYTEAGRLVQFNTFEIDARTLATQIFIAQSIKKFQLSKVITFHNGRIEDVEKFSATFLKVHNVLLAKDKSEINFYHIISGEQSQADRDQILEKFKSNETKGVSLLGNIKCLSEGVDVPTLDGIVFVDPKGSEIDIVQSVGRVIRPAENKQIGTILIPIFVDNELDHELDLENSCFKKVWQIVRALRSHDDTLAEELDNIRLELGKRTYKNPPKLSKIVMDVHIPIVEQSFAETLSLKIINKCTVLSLAQSHPEIAVQWHPIKNDNLTPNDVTAGSNQKVWWKCDKGVDHEWQATIANRIGNQSGCPMCANRKVTLSNCLATTHPDIAAQWHPTKNSLITPYQVTAGSDEIVWWQCPVARDHEWSSSVYARSKSKNCPFCVNQRACISNCLATKRADLAAQWHPIKNGILTPFEIVATSKEKVWWKCDKADDHEWQAACKTRILNKGCPYCSNKRLAKSNSLAIKNPKLSLEWHPTKNGLLTPFDIKAMSNLKVWWICSKNNEHEWYISPYARKNSNCPICSNTKVTLSNCLATTDPHIALQWHSTKNGKLTPYDVVIGSHKEVWWKCDKGDDHEWQAIILDRKRFGCLVCTNRRVVLSNCLATKNPDLATQWHQTKNDKLTPNDVTAGSNQKVWWKCSVADDHEWQACIADRRKHGCPMCSGNAISVQNCLNTTHPHLARQWNYEANRSVLNKQGNIVTPENVSRGSRLRVWWKCSKCNYLWQAVIKDRASKKNKGNCASCYKV